MSIAEHLTNFWPAITLAVGFPLVMLILSEVGASLERRGASSARTVRAVRSTVVPSLTALLFVRYVLELSTEATTSRIAESVFWVAVLYSLLGLFNDLVFRATSGDSWRGRVPKLFTDLLRAGLVAFGGMVIYSKVWGYDIAGALTALGVGSIVIGLALQEPLGNIVSGLMLLFERPLNVGDWITTNGITGKVIEINWRSVHIQTPTLELQIVPNVELYKSSFSNLSRPTDVRTERFEIGFSYDDPPNRVKEVLTELLRSTEGVLAEPAPGVRTVSYADFTINYRVSFSVASQEMLGGVRDTIMSNLWYVIRREGLTIPYPIQMEYSPGENPSGPLPKPVELLRTYPNYRGAVREEGPEPLVLDFAAGESIQNAGRRFEGFGLIIKGRAHLLARTPSGEAVVGEIGPGECFGDQLAAGSDVNELGIRAVEDVKVMVFDNKVMNELLNRTPRLAAEIGDAIEMRRQASHAAKFRHTANGRGQVG